MDTAKSVSLDLVQVSPSEANPVVCKLLDYGKYIFDKKKISTLARLKSKEIPQKKLNLGLLLIQVTIILN